MTATISILAGFFLLGVLYIATRLFLGGYLKYKGTRVITCPETKQPASIHLDSGHAASTGIFGDPELRLSDCSRWPEKKDCGQECLRQVEASPEDCLLRNILTRWYAGKTCVVCKREFGEINWYDHKPALLHPAGYTVEWEEFPPEKVGQVLSIYKPVCWNCHIAERFRLEHPDLVVDRQWVSASHEGDSKGDAHSNVDSPPPGG